MDPAKKKRATLVPTKATSALPRKRALGLAGALSVESEQEWLFYCQEEVKSKLSMETINTMIEEANSNVVVNVGREVERLKELGNRLKQGNGPHSELVAKLELKSSKRPKSNEALLTIR